jgi:hypothetical protein
MDASRGIVLKTAWYLANPGKEKVHSIALARDRQQKKREFSGVDLVCDRSLMGRTFRMARPEIA